MTETLKRVGFLCADYEDLVDLLIESPTTGCEIAFHVSFEDGTYALIRSNGDSKETTTWHVETIKSDSKKALENLQSLLSFKGDVVDTVKRRGDSKRGFSWEG